MDSGMKNWDVFPWNKAYKGIKEIKFSTAVLLELAPRPLIVS
jgi:hypothetical protein